MNKLLVGRLTSFGLLILVAGCVAPSGAEPESLGEQGEQSKEGATDAKPGVETVIYHPAPGYSCIPPLGENPSDEVTLGAVGCNGQPWHVIASFAADMDGYHQVDMPLPRSTGNIFQACSYPAYSFPSVLLRVTPQFPTCAIGQREGSLETLAVTGFDSVTDTWVPLAAEQNLGTGGGTCGPEGAFYVPTSVPDPNGGAPHSIESIRFGGSALYYTGPTTRVFVPVQLTVSVPLLC